METFDEGDEQLDLFESSAGAVRGMAWSELGPEHPLAGPQPPPGLYLGTSSWSFPGWKGLLYDGSYSEQRLAAGGLAAYAACPLFRSVSLDKSYYRPPAEREYVRLASQVPDSFRFVVKAPRDLLVPDPVSGFDPVALSRAFLEPASRGLGAKLGVVLLQFPPGAFRAVGSPERFTDHLGRLLGRLSTDLAYSLEVRDSELLGGRLHQALQDTPASLCASIHPKLPGPDRQLLSVPPTPGVPIVVRWNLRPSLGYQEARADFAPFDALKSPDPSRRDLLAHLIARALAAGRTVYVTANNKAEGCAPLSMRALLDEIWRVKDGAGAISL